VAFLGIDLAPQGLSMTITRASVFAAFLIISGGCMTSAAVKRAKGYTDERVHPSKGDTIITHGGLNYVAQQDHFVSPEKTPIMESGPYFAFKPCPGCFALLMVTVPLDIATSPFQLVGWGLETWFINGIGNTP